MTKISGKTKCFWSKTKFSNIDIDNFVLKVLEDYISQIDVRMSRVCVLVLLYSVS